MGIMCFVAPRMSNGFLLCPPNDFVGGRNLRRHSQADDKTSSYDTSDASSKGIVSSLTGLVNFIMNTKEKDDDRDGKNAKLAWSSFSREFILTPQTSPLSTSEQETLAPPPSSAVELMSRIREDYTVKNYLWTGDIDLAAFEKDCRFTDPTLSFVGTDKFVSNVQNLRVIVDNLIEPGDCRSDLLEISVNEEEQYVQSRWNMVGQLKALPWKPMIDVIGQTKFWYRHVEDGYRVYFYDECWEIPAGNALLQLITPAGTIPNSSSSNNEVK